jgi:RecA/RadA recombinase
MTPKTKSLDLNSLADRIRKTLKTPDAQKYISTGSEISTPVLPEDFIVMPSWWTETTGGLLGLPFGYEVMLSGAPDSGKSSAAIVAMKQAQEQGVFVILADTERKTTKTRLEAWGVDPSKMARVSAPYLEAMYKGIELWISAIKDEYPESKILIVIDSLGNTASFREAEVEDMEGAQQPGVAAKINKRGLKRLIPRLEKDKIALLVINQTYDILGSYGKKNAGGEGPNFFSALTFQTARMKFLEVTKNKQKVRVGARVIWTVYKNHLSLTEMVNKRTMLDITKEGIAAVGSDDSEDSEADN